MTPDQIATKGDVEALRAEIRDLKDTLGRMTIAPPARYITPKEYAIKVGKSLPTVRRWAKNGKVETHKGLYKNPDA